ncbi:hypothetical protein [Streptomyces sp. PH10-H1]|uniref:hypothetical protein n=1 Tax=Streptomyces sp. PH10-H1 TaxID=3046212 RepID=UPI0024B89FE6|nr:hypothetical protein [Streptomyces sp. PH10-H1]
MKTTVVGFLRVRALRREGRRAGRGAASKITNPSSKAKRRRDEHEPAEVGTGQAQKDLEATAVPVG